MYDLIIIGAGPAGMNAALYAKRAGLNILVIEKDNAGGLINITNKVDNYLGAGFVTGKDLVNDMINHLKLLEVSFVKEKVLNVCKNDDKFIVKTSLNTYSSKSIILGTGRAIRKKKETMFSNLEGKGVSYCALEDAPKYKDKIVGIIGGGNSAFEEGLYLSKFAKKVYFFIRRDYIKADKIFVDMANNTPNVEILMENTVTDLIEEDNKLSEVVINEQDHYKVDGLFLYIGYKPDTAYLDELELINENGYIEVNSKMETKIPGIYACGDIIQKDVYQIITAASEGAIAALSAKKYLKENKGE